MFLRRAGMFPLQPPYKSRRQKTRTTSPRSNLMEKRSAENGLSRGTRVGQPRFVCGALSVALKSPSPAQSRPRTQTLYSNTWGPPSDSPGLSMPSLARGRLPRPRDRGPRRIPRPSIPPRLSEMRRTERMSVEGAPGTRRLQCSTCCGWARRLAKTRERGV